jgi:hypothetical protein
MSADYWQELYRRINFLDGEPVIRCEEAEIIKFESQIGYPFPQSYREFVKAFGPGDFAERFKITAPGRDAKSHYDLFTFNDSTHKLRADEVDEYSPDPERHRRFLFFGKDVATNLYAWDPADVTNVELHELAIYIQYRTWDQKRLANSFEEFVRDIVFGSRHLEVFTDLPKVTFTLP